MVLYSEALSNSIITRVPVLKTKFRNFERKLMDKSVTWWNSVRQLGDKHLIVKKFEVSPENEMFFRFIDVEPEIQFLNKQAKLIIGKEVSFSNGEFKTGDQTAVEVLISLASFVKYYKNFIEIIKNVSKHKNADDFEIIMPSDIQTLTIVIGKEMPSDRDDFGVFMKQITDVDGLEDFPIWNQF